MPSAARSEIEVSPGQRYARGFVARRLPLLRAPVIVIGAGAAGASAAASAAAGGSEVLVLHKPTHSNTQMAQGGVAAAVSDADSAASHAEDTIRVGCGLSDPETVRFVTERGPDVVHWLGTIGVAFDQQQAVGRAMSLEGGHRVSRVLSAGGDSTGKAIQTALDALLAANSAITVRDDLRAVDLLVSDGRCVGVLCQAQHGGLLAIAAGETIVATGAAGQIYRETTNPAAATGDGIAMAFRAGAVLQDLEFVQFHPTTLYIAGAARVLISEAVRGAGAVLVDRDGRRVMEGRHPDLDLAPRDVVSRAILECMVQTGDTHVYLDASGIDSARERFPQIARTCAAFGIDIARDSIPVRPGAHYMVGGVRVDLEARTSLPGLFACGEAAAAGLHGANRLASNSLLEALVFGRVAGEQAAGEAASPDPSCLERLDAVPEAPNLDDGGVHLNLDDMLYSLKSLMWRQCGLARDAGPLADACEKIAFWESVLAAREVSDPKYVDLVNMLLVSRLVCIAAATRQESRGTHYRLDWPALDDSEWRRHVLLVRGRA